MEEKNETTAKKLLSNINDYSKKLYDVNQQLDKMLSLDHSLLDVLALADLYTERETYEFAIHEFRDIHDQLASNDGNQVRKITL